jgi:diaminopimelate decarboxylase
LISKLEISKIITDFNAVVDQKDTSVLVAHLPSLHERLKHLKSSFPATCIHTIAIKTNPHAQMLKALVDAGFGLEAASMEEVHYALNAGCPINKVVFDSPVKTRREINEVSRLLGMLVNVNSIEELERFPLDSSCLIGIRINPQVHTGGPEIFDVSRNESKFGVAIENKDAIIQAAMEYPVHALHMHSGSQMKNLAVQRQALENLKSLADEINKRQPGKIHTLDIGGGLPSESISPDSKMNAYGSMVAEVFADSSYQLLTEFGQWVHAEAGLAVSKIEYVLDKSRVFIHLGADFFMRDAYGVTRSFPMHVWNEHGQEVKGVMQPFDIAGPLCFAGDYLAHGAQLPQATAEGHWLSISATGANTYGLWSRHCSRSVPKYLCWDGEKLRIWSERQTINY